VVVFVYPTVAGLALYRSSKAARAWVALSLSGFSICIGSCLVVLALSYREAEQSPQEAMAKCAGGLPMLSAMLLFLSPTTWYGLLAGPLPLLSRASEGLFGRGRGVGRTEADSR